LGGVIWLLGVAAPGALFLRDLRSPRLLRDFWTLNGESVALTAVIAAAVGVFGAVLAAGTWFGLGERPPRVVRAMTRATTRFWLIGALLPGVLVGAAVNSAGSARGSRWLIDTHAGLILSHMVRFGAVAAVAGWWLRRTEPMQLRDLRTLY